MYSLYQIAILVQLYLGLEEDAVAVMVPTDRL